MIPEKIQSFRKILERNNLITVLCLLLVLVSFILNYLERRETLGKQLEFSYYVATDGEVIPARYAQRRDNIEIEIRHHLAMFVDDWYALTQDTWEAKAEAAGGSAATVSGICISRAGKPVFSIALSRVTSAMRPRSRNFGSRRTRMVPLRSKWRWIFMKRAPATPALASVRRRKYPGDRAQLAQQPARPVDRAVFGTENNSSQGR